MKKQLTITLITLLILGVIGAIIYFGFIAPPQLVTGISIVEDNLGNTHWIINGIATSIDEGYTFQSLPLKRTNSKGEEITPKETATLFISKQNSFCEYKLDRIVKELKIKVLLVTIKKIDIGYYQLLSPERVANIKVKDDSGDEKIIDGTIVRTETFYDNGGELKFTSLGIQASKRDCESPSNVALIQKEGIWQIYEKNDYDNKIGNLESISVGAGTLLFSMFDILNYLNTEIDLNTQFPSAFEDYSIIGTQTFKGDVELGSVEFTIDADQKYYNSVIYTPPREAKPIIDNIDLSNEIKTDSTASIIVYISNSGEKGSIVIDGSSDMGSIAPTSKNDILDKNLQSAFTLKAPKSEGDVKVCFKVCSVEGSNCDSKCKTSTIKEDVKDKCGNEICDSFETFVTCQEDCKKQECQSDSDCDEGFECKSNTCVKKPIEPLECGWKDLKEKETCGGNPLCWTGITKPKIVQKCVLPSWVYFVAIAVILFFIILIALLFRRVKYGGRRK